MNSAFQTANTAPWGHAPRHHDPGVAGVLHGVSGSGPQDTDYGTREFHVLDLDGNLLTFYLWR